MAGSPTIRSISATWRAKDIHQALTTNLLLQHVNHVFDPNLGHDDVTVLKLMARVGHSLLDGTLNTHQVSAALLRGKWSSALSAAAVGTRKTGGSSEQVLAAVLGLLHVPSCTIDLFALGATKSVDLTDAAKVRGLPTYTPSSKVPTEGFAPFLAAHLTRDGLLRAAGASSMELARSPDLFDFNLDYAPERARFERLIKVMEYVSNTPASFTDVMTQVQKEDWAQAEAAAAKHVSSLGIKNGSTLENPPCVADFLIMAMIPWGEPLSFTQQFSKLAASSP